MPLEKSGNDEGEFEIAMGANIEWYSQGNTSAADYESGIWISFFMHLYYYKTDILPVL